MFADLPADIRVLAAEWSKSEGALFPLAMVDADAYQRAVACVGLLGPFFEQHADQISSLQVARESAAQELAGMAEAEGVSTVGLSVGQIADAAAAHRLRVLMAKEQMSAEETSIHNSRVAGEAWASVLEPDTSGGMPGAPMVWTEIHVHSGARLLRRAAMDEDTGAAVFSIELTTTDSESPTYTQRFLSRDEWLADRERIKESYG
ncbi:MAG: hypothetical protein K0U10_07125 [Gammaproteobacteria bacterium]|nr:hypothetical protein [Gammaproteobacteria bacterium]MCH9735447.1 hypothetical protein [Actinomycetes bacterium]